MGNTITSGVFEKSLDIRCPPANSPLTKTDRTRERPFLHPLVDGRALQADFLFDLAASQYGTGPSQLNCHSHLRHRA
jgi:hypothetical protein